MSLLTLFSTPKPFTEPHINVIQRNAIRSWLMLPDTEALLIGDEPGLAEAAQETGVRHLTGVGRNAEGTPLLSSIFEIARAHSTSPLLAYVNADILLMPDFVEAARRTARQKKEFLLVGRRWDLDVTAPLDFSPDWAARLSDEARQRGRLHGPGGSDYFIFPRACFSSLPDFAVGRAGWDNWMIYKARREHWPAIDATEDVMIVHQNHDYAHLPSGQKHHQLPESKENVRLGGGPRAKKFRIHETDYLLRDGQLRRQPLSWRRLQNELYVRVNLYVSSESFRLYAIRALKFLHVQHYRRR